MRRIPVRRAALLAAALVLPTLTSGLFAAAQAYEPRIGVTGSVRDSLGNPIGGSAFLLNHIDGTPAVQHINRLC